MIFKRNLNAKNIQPFNRILEEVNWDNVYNSNDVNVAYKLFSDKLLEVYNNCCPIVKQTVNKRIDKPKSMHVIKKTCYIGSNWVKKVKRLKSVI